MSRFLAAEWDERYLTSGHNLANPRTFLMEVLSPLPKEGWGLDVAMGEGHILKPGGFLVLETMRFDPDRDQSHLRLEYLIQPGELLQSFSGWEFLVYDENVRATVKGQSQQAVQLLARKPVSET